jgi:streptomycin 6-kinase
MAMTVPPELARAAPGWFGEDGRRWLERLPGLLSQIAGLWGLELGPPYDSRTAFVARVRTRAGGEAVLKVLVPSDETASEPDALRWWGGRGAVRLLDHDPDRCAMLLESCVPGHDLWSDPDPAALATRCLRRLWVDPPPRVFEPLGERTADWAAKLEDRAARSGYAEPEAAEAAVLLRELPSSEPVRLLLHGDFHPGNVLASRREPWLAIDPQPVVGDPAFDTGQLIVNLVSRGHDPAAACRTVAGEAGLDPDRVRAWGFARAAECSLWELGMGDPDGADASLRVARALR